MTPYLKQALGTLFEVTSLNHGVKRTDLVPVEPVIGLTRECVAYSLTVRALSTDNEKT